MEQKIDNFHPGFPFSDKRPTSITLVCLLGFLGLGFAVLGILIPNVRNQIINQYDFYFILFAILTSILSLLGLIGYWKMRKWGVCFYTVSAAISIMYSILSGLSPDKILNFGDYLVLVVGFIYFKKMK